MPAGARCGTRSPGAGVALTGSWKQSDMGARHSSSLLQEHYTLSHGGGGGAGTHCVVLAGLLAWNAWNTPASDFQVLRLKMAHYPGPRPSLLSILPPFLPF